MGQNGQAPENGRLSGILRLWHALLEERHERQGAGALLLASAAGLMFLPSFRFTVRPREDEAKR